MKSPPFIVAIRPATFFYDYLGDRRRLVAGENFGLLIGDLQEFPTGAYWPSRVREYIENGPKGAGDFKNAPEFGRYNQWLYEAFAAA